MGSDGTAMAKAHTISSELGARWSADQGRPSIVADQEIAVVRGVKTRQHFETNVSRRPKAHPPRLNRHYRIGIQTRQTQHQEPKTLNHWLIPNLYPSNAPPMH